MKIKIFRFFCTSEFSIRSGFYNIKCCGKDSKNTLITALFVLFHIFNDKLTF